MDFFSSSVNNLGSLNDNLDGFAVKNHEII